jgi:hypothetical protein
MADMNNPTSLPSRRTVIASSVALVGTAAFASPTARLTLHSDKVLNHVPANYCGFSAETAQLSDPAYYDGGNTSLVALHRRLSPNGVLRLGGNTSELCYWKTAPDAPPPPIKIPGQGRADNTMPQRFVGITPEAVTNLRGFLDTCGWTCIYGLNFGTGTPERDAEEAAFVARTLGARLMCFEIGNEPDLYITPNNLLRPAGWGFDDYMREWLAIAQAVSARAPGVKFAGPGATGQIDWIVRFAHEASKGAQVIGLTGHYYASGPPESPAVNITNLLKRDPIVAERMNAIMPAARAASLPFRITETNSCYRGGKPDMSNALASALWGGDYMLNIAALGGKGVHFHGGLGKQIAASVGDKLPGVRNAADQEIARLGTFYSPWAGNRSEGFSARPLFYGMMLVEQFAETDLVANSFDSAGANATAYAAKSAEGFRIAVFNKDATRDLTVEINLGTAARRAHVWRLTGPRLDAITGIALAGAEVSNGDCEWRPHTVETASVNGSTVVLAVPHASAALLFVER